MIFIGDVHGKIKRLRSLIRPLAVGARCFQLGDMGLGFKGVYLHPYEGERLRFIRGNHDDPAACRRHPNYAGDYGYRPEDELFFCGGAWSIDYAYRVEGVSWWRDEELSQAELEKALDLYVQCKPRIVATHEAPSQAALLTLRSASTGFSNSNPALTSVILDEQYAYYKEKLGCVDSRTSRALQAMFAAWQPEHWIFGHYHSNQDFVIGRTKFRCLDELSTMELELADDQKQPAV